MKKLFLIIVVLITVLMQQSCYETFYELESRQSEFKSWALGKDKNTIIRTFIVPVSDIKRLDEHYEILICQRYANYYVGWRYTKFYMKDDKCYDVETNEYTPVAKKVRVL